MNNREPFIVAISGKSGCGNSTVSELLSKQLGFRLINYTFKNMAAEFGMSFQELLEKSATDVSYDKILDSRQIMLAKENNCVIGSRLAMWLLPDADLRIYLHASESTRASRIQERDGGDIETILEFTRRRDCADHERFKKLYDIDNDNFLNADIVVNTERLNPKTIVDMLFSLITNIYSITAEKK